MKVKIVHLYFKIFLLRSASYLQVFAHWNEVHTWLELFIFGHSFLCILQSSVLVSNRHLDSSRVLFRSTFEWNQSVQVLLLQFSYFFLDDVWNILHMTLETALKWLVLGVNAKFECPPRFTLPLFIYFSGRPSIESFYR